MSDDEFQTQNLDQANDNGDDALELMRRMGDRRRRAAGAQSPIPPRLRIVMPDKRVKVFALFPPHLLVGRTAAIGRQDIDIDLAYYDVGVYGVSRLHAKLEPDDTAGVILQDLNSVNGTYVNGKKIEPNLKYPLRSGDYIKFGNLKIQLFFEYDESNGADHT